MTTRQYIGARYVPVFADPVEWDDTRTYEHLMMVQHQGETYISQQAVPIGIDLPDTSQGEESNEYWVHMSNWNAQVETYRQEVLEYNGRISTLENDLPLAGFDSENTVKDAIDGIKEQIGTGFDATDNIAAIIGSGFDATDNIASVISSEKTAREAQDAIRAIDFSNVAAMKASDDIENGMIVHTLGFYNAGDGGAAYYLISNSGTANEMDVIACGDLYASIIIENDVLIPEMLGAKLGTSDTSFDNSPYINRAIVLMENKTVKLKGQYNITTPIIIANEVNIEGVNTASTWIRPVNTTAIQVDCGHITLKNFSIRLATRYTSASNTLNGIIINNDNSSIYENVICENVYIDGFQYGIYANKLYSSKFINLSTGYCLVGYATKDKHVNVQFVDCSFSPSISSLANSVGIDVGYVSEGITIQNCLFFGCYDSIYFSNSANSIIEGCIIDSVLHNGITVVGSTSLGSNMHIANNMIYMNDGANIGIYLTNTVSSYQNYGNKIIGNAIYVYPSHSADYGIREYGAETKYNIIMGNSLIGTFTKDIDVISENSKVIGNHCTGTIDVYGEMFGNDAATQSTHRFYTFMNVCGKKMYYDTALPTAGEGKAYQVGDMFVNIGSVLSGKIYVCTAAGTPGTWEAV